MQNTNTENNGQFVYIEESQLVNETKKVCKSARELYEHLSYIGVSALYHALHGGKNGKILQSVIDTIQEDFSELAKDFTNWIESNTPFQFDKELGRQKFSKEKADSFVQNTYEYFLAHLSASSFSLYMKDRKNTKRKVKKADVSPEKAQEKLLDDLESVIDRIIDYNDLPSEKVAEVLTKKGIVPSVQVPDNLEQLLTLAEKLLKKDTFSVDTGISTATAELIISVKDRIAILEKE